MLCTGDPSSNFYSKPTYFPLFFTRGLGVPSLREHILLGQRLPRSLCFMRGLGALSSENTFVNLKLVKGAHIISISSHFRGIMLD